MSTDNLDVNTSLFRQPARDFGLGPVEENEFADYVLAALGDQFQRSGLDAWKCFGASVVKEAQAGVCYAVIFTEGGFSPAHP